MSVKEIKEVEKKVILDLMITIKELEIFIEAFRDILNDLVIQPNQCQKETLYISQLLDRLIIIYMKITNNNVFHI
ncbi:hypothetical protein SH2C18_37790 [Clostridium sediminicola]|uniref:Spo0E family sporulation regulatory protein-aspartic acid phosphatase n=1 Tax=Clostridium sediminicola TaxID=3114879 RepID=UPI0031F26170